MSAPVRRTAPGAFSRDGAPFFVTFFIWSVGTGAQGLARPLFAFLVSGNVFYAPLIAATNALARMAAGPITGYMTDRVGRKPLIVLGTGLRAGSSFAEIFVDTFAAFAVLEFIGQIGVSMWVTSTNVLIADVSDTSNRGRVVAARTVSQRLGMILGPLIAGGLAMIDLRWVFALNGVTKTVSLLIALFLFAETRPDSAKERTSQPGARRGLDFSFFRSRAFVALAVATFGLSMMAQGVFMSLLPVHLKDVLEMPEGQIGLLATLAGAVALGVAMPNGWLVDRFGRKKTLVPGLALLAAAAFGFANAGAFGAVLAVVLLYGVAEGFVMGSSQAYAMDLAPEARRGEFLGVWAVFQNAGAFGAPLVIGALYAALGPYAAFTAAAAWLLVSAVLMAVLGPETGGRARTRAPIRSP
ncbi:MAG: MFS transporter [Chloroflexota bacterium]|nr:MFS transporter [Chloroflexota bacterium]